jgi:hypothetical protein
MAFSLVIGGCRKEPMQNSSQMENVAFVDKCTPGYAPLQQTVPAFDRFCRGLTGHDAAPQRVLRAGGRLDTGTRPSGVKRA